MRYKRTWKNPPTGKQLASEGPDGPAHVAILSLAPDKTDILADAPLRGPKGGLFRQVCHNLGMNPEDIWKFHILDWLVEGPTITHMAEAYEQTWIEIKWLIETKQLKVIIALGEGVMKFLDIAGDVRNNRGSVYEINLGWKGVVTDPNSEPCDVPCVVTHDFDWLYNNRWTRGGKGTADGIVNAINDFEKARRIASHGYKRFEENFVLYPTLETFQTWAIDVLKKKPLLAVDIETDGFSGKPIVIGFATSGEHAFSVPILKQRGLEYWQPHEWPTVKKYLNDILSTVPQVYQNALFDVPRLFSFGLKATFRMVKHDTMLLHHIIDPESPHGLGYITSIYGATPFWKEGIFDQDVKITDLPDDRVRTYNLRDCVVLHQILPGLLQDLDELGPETARVYNEGSLKLLGPVHAMHSNGIKLSEARLNDFKDRLSDMLVEQEHTIRGLFGLPEGFNLGSSDHLGIILYGIVPQKFLDAPQTMEGKKPGTKLYGELEQQVKLSQLKPLWAFGKSMFRIPTGQKSSKPATDAGARLALIVAANKRLDVLEQRGQIDSDEARSIEKLIQFLDMFAEFQELKKLDSTYTSFPTWADGRVHGQFLIHGTSTGRLASKKPNMQNFPKKSKMGKEIRKLFVAPRGKIFISADYSNLEARIVGYEADEPAIQEIFARGLNQHDINTTNLFGLTSADEKWDLARRAAKTFQFGLIQYGGSDREIHRKISIEVPELGLTLKDLQLAKENYFQANPNLLKWRLRIEKEVTETRKISNAFGRVRLFKSNAKDIVKEAYNFPMQSVAADIINDAMIRLFKLCLDQYPETQLILQVHDQLIFESPDKPQYIKQIIKVIKKEMERPRRAWGKQVSFPVDFEVGYSLGELTSYEL